MHTTPYHPQGNAVSERMHRTMKAILATLCKGQPSKWPHYLKQCQRVINNEVHETTGEQPYYLMFHRRAPRRVTAALPTIDQDANIEVALTAVRRTNSEQSRKYLDRANIGKQNQSVEVNQLVWVQRDYVTSRTDRKLGAIRVSPYKVKEVVRGGRAYAVENTFDGTTIRRAAGKIKPYRGGGDIVTQLQEIVNQQDSDVSGSETEAEEERRPVRERRPPRRYGSPVQNQAPRRRTPPRREKVGAQASEVSDQERTAGSQAGRGREETNSSDEEEK